MRVKESTNWIAGDECGHFRRMQLNVSLRNGRKPIVLAVELRKDFPQRWPTDHAAEMMVRRWKAGPQFRAWLATQEDQDKLLRTVEAMELKLGLIGDQPEKLLARSLLLQIMSGDSSDEEKAAAAASLIGAIGSIDEGARQNVKLKQGQQKIEISKSKLQFDKEKFETECCKHFLAWFNDQKARTIADSNAPRAEKIAQLRQAYFADIEALEKSGGVALPQ